MKVIINTYNNLMSRQAQYSVCNEGFLLFYPILSVSALKIGLFCTENLVCLIAPTTLCSTERAGIAVKSTQE